MQQNNGLDRNQLISFMLFSALMLGAMFYFQNKQNKEAQVAADSKANVEKVATSATPIQAPVMAQTDSTAATVQNVKMQNDELVLDFSTLGGQLSSVELKNYKAYDKATDQADLPLRLIEKNNSIYGFEFQDRTGRVVSTRNLVFSPSQTGNTLTLTAKASTATIQFIYTLLPNYTLDFKVRTKGLAGVSNGTEADFKWDHSVINLEKGRSQEQTHTEFSYAFDNYKSYDYDARSGMDETGEILNWIGVKQQFFASVIEAKRGFHGSTGRQEMIEEGQYLKKFNYNGKVQLNAGELNEDFSWYFLPLDLKLLKSYDKNFDEILPLGWSFIGTMNRWFFIPMYNLISSWGISAGWVIFLMTIIVKLILSPIMFKQHKLSAMMRVIRPEIEEVNEKHKNSDPMKRQQATMEVYRKAGVNQMAGCLPALLQIPIFYALFRFFPNFINLRGESFWFAKDLTAYDDLIKLPFHIPFLGEHLSVFAIACTAVILIYTMLTAGNMQQPAAPGMPNMKVLMYIFPITFLFFLNTMASGLSWYYFVSNAINIVIILVIKYWILDEDKIHAQIQMNKAQPKKEGKFQKRMREMMEQAQEQQKLQQQQARRTPTKKK